MASSESSGTSLIQSGFRVYCPRTINNDPIYWKSYKSILAAIRTVYKNLETLHQCLEIFKEVYEGAYPMGPRLPIKSFFKNFETYIYNPCSDNGEEEEEEAKINMEALIELLHNLLSHKNDNELVAYTAVENDDEINQETHQIKLKMGRIITAAYLSHPPGISVGSIESKGFIHFICNIIGFIDFNFTEFSTVMESNFGSLESHSVSSIKKKYRKNDDFDKKIKSKSIYLNYIQHKIISRIKYVTFLSNIIILHTKVDVFSEFDVTIPSLIFQHIDPALLNLSDLKKFQRLSLYNKINSAPITSRKSPSLFFKKVELRIVSDVGYRYILISEHGFSIGSVIDDLLSIYEIPLTETIKEKFANLVTLGQHQCVGSSYIFNRILEQTDLQNNNQYSDRILVQTGAELGIIYRLRDSKGFTLTVSDRLFLDKNYHQIYAISLILSSFNIHMIKTEGIEDFMTSENGKSRIQSLDSFNIHKVTEGTVHNYLLPMSERDQKTGFCFVSSFPGSSFVNPLNHDSSFIHKNFDLSSRRKSPVTSLGMGLGEISRIGGCQKSLRHDQGMPDELELPTSLYPSSTSSTYPLSSFCFPPTFTELGHVSSIQDLMRGLNNKLFETTTLREFQGDLKHIDETQDESQSYSSNQHSSSSSSLSGKWPLSPSSISSNQELGPLKEEKDSIESLHVTLCKSDICSECQKDSHHLEETSEEPCSPIPQPSLCLYGFPGFQEDPVSTSDSHIVMEFGSLREKKLSRESLDTALGGESNHPQELESSLQLPPKANEISSLPSSFSQLSLPPPSFSPKSPVFSDEYPNPFDGLSSSTSSDILSKGSSDDSDPLEPSSLKKRKATGSKFFPVIEESLSSQSGAELLEQPSTSTTSTSLSSAVKTKKRKNRNRNGIDC